MLRKVMLRESILRYVVAFRISSERLSRVESVLYLKAPPPCCFLLIIGNVSTLKVEFLSDRIGVFKCNR